MLNCGNALTDLTKHEVHKDTKEKTFVSFVFKEFNHARKPSRHR